MFKNLFRFSLKTFLVIVLAIGTFGAWIANHHFTYQKEMQFVDQLIDSDKRFAQSPFGQLSSKSLTKDGDSTIISGYSGIS
jgi:hypothetical protein